MLDGTGSGVNPPPFEVQIALPLTERFGYTFATTYPDMTPAKAPFESSRLIRTRFAIPLLLASLTVAHQANAAEPREHKVAAGTLKTTVQWDAVFEAKVMQPVKATPKAWFDMTVIDALDHGSHVEKGDVLVRLDLEKLREQIADQERDQPLSKIALELAQADLRNLTESTPARLDTARRNQKIASEEFDYFVSTGRPQREKSAAFSVKGAEDRLEGAREELRQLEKMYKADDLTEESEEIVLKRQRFAVESSEFYLNYTKLNTERELNVTLPRELDSLKSKKRDEEMLLSFWDATLPQSLEKKRLDVEKCLDSLRMSPFGLDENVPFGRWLR